MCDVVYDSIGTGAPLKNKYTDALKYIFPNIVIPDQIEDVSKDTSVIVILYTAITTLKELDKRSDVFDRALLPKRLRSSGFEERQVYSMMLTDIYNEYIVSRFKPKHQLSEYKDYFHTYPLYIEDDECSLMFSPIYLKNLPIRKLIHIGNYFEFEAADKYYKKKYPQYYKQKSELVKSFRMVYRSDRSKAIQKLQHYLQLQGAANVHVLRMAIALKIDVALPDEYKVRIAEEFEWQCSAITKAIQYAEAPKGRRIPRCEMYDEIDQQRH